MQALNQKRIILLGALLALMLSVPLPAAERNQKAGDCALRTLDGSRRLTLEEFRGKVVYLDFWASWCGPCAKSFPFMNALHQELSAKGLAVVAVNLDENPEDARAFLQSHPAGFTLAADTGEQCARQFDVKAMPSSYLIDRAGVIREVALGFRDGEAETLRKTVDTLLSEPAASAGDKH